MDQAKTDIMIRYILAVAAQGWGDFNSKDVGPIHIVQYVYLADLAYAEKHNGNSFSGVEWKFHHFGPWSTELYKRIEPACLAVNASKRTITDTEYDDFDRWSIEDSDHVDAISKELPLIISLTIDNKFKMFVTDTYDLLDYVYSTVPMRYAAPGEKLSFILAYETLQEQIKDKQKLKEYIPPVKTARQKKIRKRALQELKEKLHRKRNEKDKNQNSKFVTPSQPRYDELFYKGQEWLDTLAGKPIANSEGELSISDSVWKSQARNEPNV